MPQRFLCALAFTLTLATNLNPMTRDDDHHDGSKLTLPHFDPKDPTYFDDLQAYAQDRGLGWLLHADGDDTNDISKYEDMQSDTYKNLTGDDATDDDKDKARRWIHCCRSGSDWKTLSRTEKSTAIKCRQIEGANARLVFSREVCRPEVTQESLVVGLLP